MLARSCAPIPLIAVGWRSSVCDLACVLEFSLGGLTRPAMACQVRASVLHASAKASVVSLLWFCIRVSESRAAPPARCCSDVKIRMLGRGPHVSEKYDGAISVEGADAINGELSRELMQRLCDA